MLHSVRICIQNHLSCLQKYIGTIQNPTSHRGQNDHIHRTELASVAFGILIKVDAFLPAVRTLQKARPVAILPASSSPILSRMKAKHDPSPPSQLLICRKKNLAVPRRQVLTDVNMLPNTLLPASSLTGTQNVDPDKKDTREPSEPGIISRSGVQPERELVH